MRETALLLAVLVILRLPTNAFSAHAATKEKLNLAPPGQEAANTEDPGSATRLLYEDPRNQNSLTAGTGTKEDASLKPTCTDNMGMIYKKGAAGYDGCLRTFGAGTPPQLPGDKRNRSLGITIGQ